MAGTRIALRANQVLFEAGDASNGMFIVRTGELMVYLKKDGKEIELARMAKGG